VTSTSTGSPCGFLTSTALKRQSNVVIKDTAEDIHTAIDRAAGRVGRTVARQLSRKTWRSRHPFLRGKTHFHSNESTTGELLA
jgi:ribosome-associated translation inhibitor RaiA